MISADLDAKSIDRAMQVIRDSENEVLAPEFQVSADQVIPAIVKDYRSGVSAISGDLKAGITGELKSVAGVEMDAVFAQRAEHGGYNYGQRLDQDGRMHWRSGKFKGRKTWGWWSYVYIKIAKKQSRKYFTQALDRTVTRLAEEIHT